LRHNKPVFDFSNLQKIAHKISREIKEGKYEILRLVFKKKD